MPDGHSFEFDERFVPLQSPTARFVSIDREAVVLDSLGRVYRLNPTAALLWACFDGTGSLAEIAQDVSDELGVPYSGVLDEIVTLARGLGEAGLLANVEPSPDGVAPQPPATADTCPEEPAPTLETSGQGDQRFVPEPPNT